MNAVVRRLQIKEICLTWGSVSIVKFLKANINEIRKQESNYVEFMYGTRCLN